MTKEINLLSSMRFSIMTFLNDFQKILLKMKKIVKFGSNYHRHLATISFANYPTLE